MKLPHEFDYAEAFSSKNFFFGVANAPYLCEGGFNYPDGIKNNFYLYEKEGKIEKSGEATRFWTTYEEHIKLAASLGLNAFRMGFEWPRIQPTTSENPHTPPDWDFEAVDQYAKIVETLIKYKMEPIITLHHFCHPAWLDVDMWLGDEGPNLFVEYALKIVEEVNLRLLENTNRVINFFVVINEANIFPILLYLLSFAPTTKKGTRYMVRAFDNLFYSYVRIYDGLYDLYEKKSWKTPHIGFNTATVSQYEADKLWIDIVRVRSWGYERSEVDIKLREHKSRWTKRVHDLAKVKLNKESFEAYNRLKKLSEQTTYPSYLKKTLDFIYNSKRIKKLDYIAVDIYEPYSAAKSAGLGKMIDWWEYAIDPDVYRTFIQAYNDFNTNLPLYLIENTCAYKQPIGGKAELRPDGCTRERYFKLYLPEMIKCMNEGIPIKGFLYWSLTDDYEWNTYEQRHGLFKYDYINQIIKDTDGLGEPAGKIYAKLISTLRNGNKEEIFKQFNF